MKSMFSGLLLLGVAMALVPCGAEAATQKKVIVDFEDFGTWRLRESSGERPGTWWPAFANLSGSATAKYHGDCVGELKFDFDPAGKGPFVLGFERAKMSQISGFLEGIEFDADARDFHVSLGFEIQDAAGKKFRVRPVPLEGSGWKHYRVELNAETVAGFEKCKFPARLKRVILEAASPCQGAVMLDDITLTGNFTRKDQLGVVPIYDRIFFEPDKNVKLRYRLYNARPEKLSGTMRIEIRDFSGHRVFGKEASFSVDSWGQKEMGFDVGAYPLGAYEVVVTAKAGAYEADYQDQFGVMVPNAGRPNKHPMWFGIGDQSSWQGDLENGRHLEWMHLLGVDINRLGFLTNRLQSEEGLAEVGWKKLFKEHADAGVDILLMYDGIPPWTQSRPQWRGAADLFPVFEEHARRVARMTKEFPNITYLEFFNEPDLDFYIGTFDQYLEMLRRFYKNFKEVNPEVIITTGGVTIKHPKEKKDFSKDVYQKGADFYDVAAYHAHGPLVNNQMRQEMLEGWLKEAGLKKHFINTETGDRSLYNPEGRKRQAVTLVKKIVYSKSVPGFDAYFWFTLQDYWDMDPEADDSFGLVTSDNRPKASFVAYNTLIRELANTSPAPAVPGVADLSLYAFRKDDGRYVYVGWPVETKAGGILWIKTKQEVEVSDMFGVKHKYAPLGDVVPIPFGDLPLYISGNTPGEVIQVCPPEEAFLQLNAEVHYSGSADVRVPVAFRNPTSREIEVALSLRAGKGGEVARKVFKVQPGQKMEWLPIIPVKTIQQAVSPSLVLELAGGKSEGFSFPLKFIETYPIKRVPPLSADPSAWPSLDGVPALVVDRPEQVFELTYDPSIRAWQGPEDLSVTARVVHDGRGIRFQAVVKDDAQGASHNKDEMWRGDDIQLAFGGTGSSKLTILDLGRSGDGAVVWCSESADPKKLHQWEVPVKVEKKGSVTVYDCYLPFDKLGYSPDKAGNQVRFSFLANEDDGQGRVRWIEWTPGIARDRSLESLGYGQLE